MQDQAKDRPAAHLTPDFNIGRLARELEAIDKKES
jgi:hypothetical protein